MKEAIIGYLTALIDSHQTNTEKLKKQIGRCNFKELDKHKRLTDICHYNEEFTEELEHLLEFVMDIPDEKRSIEMDDNLSSKTFSTVKIIKSDDVPEEIKQAIETMLKQKL